MGSILGQLVPLMIGSMMMPTWVLLVLFMLRSEHGLVPAVAFVGGVTLARLAQGVLFGTVLNAYKVVHRPSAVATVVATLMVVTGVLLCVTALKQVLGQDEDDIDRAMPKLMDLINALTPLRALGLGALLVVTSSRAWIFTLTALGVIAQGDLSAAQSVVAFLLYVLGTQLLLLTPIVVSIRSPARLDTAARWLEDNSRTIVVAVSFIVGTYFLWRGLAGLLS